MSVIDCGGGVTASFLKRGYDPLQVDRMFITHTHPDHCCDIPLFIQLIYLSGRKERFDLFLPEEFVDPFKVFLNAVYIPPEKLPFELTINGYREGFEYTGDFELRAHGNKHLQGYKEIIGKLGLPNKMQSHSFEVEVGDKKIFYSGDITGFDEIKPFIRNADYVVMEMTHVKLEEFFEEAGQYDGVRFVISHLGDRNQVEEINLFVRKAGVENVLMSIDGMELPL